MDGKATQTEFGFVDINPGFCGLAFAAEDLGGYCVGTLCLRQRERAEYERYHGRGRAEPPEGGCDVALVSLPFSMFVRPESGDPGVTDLIFAARNVHAPAVLFRVDWSNAARLGVSVDEYVEAVESRFESKRWVVSSAVTASLRDLFIAVVHRKRWTGTDPLPAFVERAEPIVPGNPQEMLLALGYPTSFALLKATSPLKIVSRVVDVRDARAALARLMSTVR